MIPKIIHYCWLSGDPWDKKTQKCFETWIKFIPDWEYKYWTIDSLPQEVLDMPTVKWAIKNKKWAFAADYIRFWALYNYGGLYMDLDVELIKSPEDLLSQQLVVGFEKDLIGGHFIAAIPHHLFTKTVEEQLRNKMKQEPLPSFISPIYNEMKKKIPDIIPSPYPESYFNPFYWDQNKQEGKLNKTTDTYCIHWYVGGWIPKYKKTYAYKVIVSIANAIGLVPCLRKLRGY